MTLLGLVSAIAGFVKVRFLQDKEVIDTTLFRLHSRVTCAIMFLACALCTATTLLGDPISCLTDYKEGKLDKPINTYCWISSTFTLFDNLDKPATHVPHPGLGPYEHGRDRQVYHSYYQWVPFTLLFQGILFYLPHWVWKTMEQKRIYTITKGLRGIRMDLDGVDKTAGQLGDYLVDTLHCNFIYGFGYLACELLNLINVVGNLFLINKFLGDVFFSYGIEVISFASMDQTNRTDPMIKVFPRITKCTFPTFGPSGSIQIYDIMCVMAINVLNEKIYIFLWFWLFLLCALTIVSLLHCLVLAVSQDYRAIVLRKKFLSRSEAEFLAHTLPFGDYMLLNLLNYNLDSNLFDRVLQKMCQRLNYSGCKLSYD